MIVRQDHRIDIDDICCCAFAGTGNRRHRFEFSNLGKLQLAGRTFGIRSLALKFDLLEREGAHVAMVQSRISQLKPSPLEGR